MATLDDKLLGEKLHYYCSSSEDEDEGEKGAKFIPESELREGKTSANTGPKGVIEDWRRYKQLERENREDQEKEKVELAKKLAMTCRTDKEDQEAKAKEEKQDEDLEALLDDEFLAAYMERRMKEMIQENMSKKKYFGKLIDLDDVDQFLHAIDKEDKSVVVVIFIYEKDVAGCEAMNGCLQIVAKDHSYVKFCRILASTAGLSKHFKVSGVPALLVYRAGDLMTYFVRVTDVLGEDFFASDVESYLTEHGVLSDKDLMPSIIKGPAEQDDDDDD